MDIEIYTKNSGMGRLTDTQEHFAKFRRSQKLFGKPRKFTRLLIVRSLTLLNLFICISLNTWPGTGLL